MPSQRAGKDAGRKSPAETQRRTPLPPATATQLGIGVHPAHPATREHQELPLRQPLLSLRPRSAATRGLSLGPRVLQGHIILSPSTRLSRAKPPSTHLLNHFSTPSPHLLHSPLIPTPPSTPSRPAFWPAERACGCFESRHLVRGGRRRCDGRQGVILSVRSKSPALAAGGQYVQAPKKFGPALTRGPWRRSGGEQLCFPTASAAPRCSVPTSSPRAPAGRCRRCALLPGRRQTGSWPQTSDGIRSHRRAVAASR